MQPFKHYSFDLWGTLIKSNPAFKKQRALFFHKHYNTLKKNIETVEQIFRTVDLMCNAINEKTGSNIDAEEMYLMVIFLLNDNLIPATDIDLKKLYTDIEQLLFNYPPTVYDTATHSCLKRIKDQPLTTTNTLSNTAFIKGATLRKMMTDQLKLSGYFDFQMYSDEVGYSKPNKHIFYLLVENIHQLHPPSTIELQHIIHIGDNRLADIVGAISIGIQAFQINTNNCHIQDLLNPCS